MQTDVATAMLVVIIVVGRLPRAEVSDRLQADDRFQTTTTRPPRLQQSTAAARTGCRISAIRRFDTAVCWTGQKRRKSAFKTIE